MQWEDARFNLGLEVLDHALLVVNMFAHLQRKHRLFPVQPFEAYFANALRDKLLGFLCRWDSHCKHVERGFLN